MRRLVVFLLVLLVGTNAAWLLLGRGSQPAARATGTREAVLAAENRELRRTVEDLRVQIEQPRPAPVAPERARPEEKAAPPAPDPRQEAQALSERWTKDALQIEDAAKRAATIEEVRSALASSDITRRLAALMTFPQLRELDFDKALFRPLILPCFESTVPGVRRAAIYALFNTGVQPGDLDLVLSIADDPELKTSITHAIFMFSKGQITGKAADAVLKVLASEEKSVKREGMRGIWGATVSPEVEARLLEIARDPAMRYDAIYFALSTLANKSEAVVDLLAEAAASPDGNVRQRARWGLTYGVTPEGRPKAADVYLDILRNDFRNGEDALRIIREYGNERHLEALVELARNPAVPESMRKPIEVAIAELRRRLKR